MITAFGNELAQLMGNDATLDTVVMGEAAANADIFSVPHFHLSQVGDLEVVDATLN